MHQKLTDPIEVEVIFLRGRAMPRTFSWNGHMYRIKQVGLIHHAYEGRQKVFFFSVSDGVNFFCLKFFTDTCNWQLVEMYNEG